MSRADGGQTTCLMYCLTPMFHESSLEQNKRKNRASGIQRSGKQRGKQWHARVCNVTAKLKWKDWWCLRRFKSSQSFFKEKNELLTSQTRIGFRRNTRNGHFHEHPLLLDRRHVSGLCKTLRIDKFSLGLKLQRQAQKGEEEGEGRKARKRVPPPFSLPLYPLPLSRPATQSRGAWTALSLPVVVRY